MISGLSVSFAQAEAFLPVAEVFARTGRHAENFRTFFNTKVPRGAGFPVQFSIPVFPTVTAQVFVGVEVAAMLKHICARS
jgi:hypothetical protein